MLHTLLHLSADPQSWLHLGHFPLDSLYIAEFKDTLGSDFQSAWTKFLESGQVWALLIGVFIGYIVRNFTAF